MRDAIAVWFIALGLFLSAISIVPGAELTPDENVSRIVKQVTEPRGGALTDKLIGEFWSSVPSSIFADMVRSQAGRQQLQLPLTLFLETWRSAKLSRQQGRATGTARYLGLKAFVESTPSMPADYSSLLQTAERIIEAAVVGESAATFREVAVIDAEKIEVSISQYEAVEYRLNALLNQSYGMPERAWLLDRVRAAAFSQFPFVLSIDKRTIFAPDAQTGAVVTYTYHFDEDIIETVSGFQATRVFSEAELEAISVSQFLLHDTPVRSTKETFRGNPSILVIGGPTAPGDADGLVSRFIQDPISRRVTIVTSHSWLGEDVARSHHAGFEKRLTLY